MRMQGVREDLERAKQHINVLAKEGKAIEKENRELKAETWTQTPNHPCFWRSTKRLLRQRS